MSISIGTLRKHSQTDSVTVRADITDDAGKVVQSIDIPLVRRGDRIQPGAYFFDNSPTILAKPADWEPRVQAFVDKHRAAVEALFPRTTFEWRNFRVEARDDGDAWRGELYEPDETTAMHVFEVDVHRSLDNMVGAHDLVDRLELARRVAQEAGVLRTARLS